MVTFTDVEGVPIVEGQPVVISTGLGRSSSRCWPGVVVGFTPQRVRVQTLVDNRGRNHRDPNFTELSKPTLVGAAGRVMKNGNHKIWNIIVVHTMWPEAQRLVDLHLGTPELDNALLGI